MTVGRTGRIATVALFLLPCVPRAASAHVFGGNGGPAAGFMHPLTGADHLLAMVAVGVLSAQIGGRAIWTVPSAFVLVMIAGGVLGAMAPPLRGIELGIAFSVLILGAAIAGGGAVPAWSALAAAGFFGFFHGYVHGTEMPAAASPALYAVGFAVSTAGLHVLGALTGLLVLCRERGSIRLRGAGLVVALAGVYFIVAGLRRPLPPAKHALTVSAQR
jgi:urease accessory protein